MRAREPSQIMVFLLMVAPFLAAPVPALAEQAITDRAKIVTIFQEKPSSRRFASFVRWLYSL